jgi:hypothetical protein
MSQSETLQPRSWQEFVAAAESSEPVPAAIDLPYLKKHFDESIHYKLLPTVRESNAAMAKLPDALAARGLECRWKPVSVEPIPETATEMKAAGELAYEQGVLNRIKLDVIGERENGTVVVFSLFHKKMREIHDIDKLRYPKLLQICGEPAKRAVTEVSSDSPNDQIAFNEVKRIIGYCAGYNLLDESRIAGPGCWMALNENQEPDDAVVMVGAGEGAYLNGDVTLKKVANPRHGGRILGLSNADDWYSYDQIKGYIENYSPEWAEGVIGQATELFNRWAWRYQKISPCVMVGLVLATWVQTVWAWRPQVEINGAKNTGKTTLFHALECIFGNLCELSSKSSAAGLRQIIQQTAKVMIADEFEKSRHRPEILEMIRASGRGDKIVMGTSHHVAKRFVVQHMFWIGAIETGLISAVDRSRFISMELVPPETERAGMLTLPNRQDLHELGQKLLAIAVRNAIAARRLAISLKSYRQAGIDQRVIENYAVPAAMLATVFGDEDASARKLLDDFLKGVADEDQKMSDEEDLLEVILRANVRVGINDERTVASLIDREEEHCRDALERHGIGVIYGRPGARPANRLNLDDWFLFIDHKDIAAKLLFRSGADWSGKAIDKILKRIEGASVKQATIAGRRTLGVWVPMRFVRKNFLCDSDSSAGSF